MSAAYPQVEDLVPDGLTTVFTLQYPPIPETLLVLYNGQTQRGTYTISGTTLTLIGWIPQASDSLAVYYTTKTATPAFTGGPGGIRFNPEAIANALFILLGQANYAFASMDRRGHLPQNTVIANQPHLCLVQVSGTAVQDTAIGLTKWRLEFWVLVYIRVDANPSTVPATAWNAALQAIANVMSSVPPGERQTLGGIVNNAWIDGELLFRGGIEDEQTSMKIPIIVETGI